MIRNKKSLLKQYFFTGAKPSQEEFADLVECIAILLSDKSLRVGFEHLEVDDPLFLDEYILDVIGDVRINGNMELDGDEGGGGFKTSNINGSDADNGALHLNQGTGQPVTIGKKGNNGDPGQGNLIVHGKLGVGTTAPSLNLEVKGKGGFSQGLGIALPMQQPATEGATPQATEPDIPLAIGDPDTGLDFEEGGQLKLVTNDQSRILIDGAGNITMGSAPPQTNETPTLNFEVGKDEFPYNLTVSGTSTLKQIVTIGTDTATTYLKVTGKSELDGNVGIGGVTDPAIQLSLGDNLTGLEGSADQLQLKTNNAPRITIHKAGNVDIGAAQPINGDRPPLMLKVGNATVAYGLEVTGESALKQKVAIGTDAAATNLKVTGKSELDGNVGIGGVTGPTLQLALGANGTGLEGSAENLQLKTNNAARITIHKAGNIDIGAAQPIAGDSTPLLLKVGNSTVAYGLEVTGESTLKKKVAIGTSAEAANLQVTGKSELKGNVGIGNLTNPAIQLTLGDNYTGLEGSADKLSLKTGNQDRLTINQNGKVSIGQENPQDLVTKLAVNGHAQVIGKLDVGNDKTANECLTVNGKTTINGQTTINDNVNVGATGETKEVTINGNLTVTGDIHNDRTSMVLGKPGQSDGSLVVHGAIEAKAGTVKASDNVEAGGRMRDKTGDVMPVGSIIAYGGSTLPDGWLLCDGQTSFGNNKLYADLKRVLDSNKTPDLRTRFIVGAIVNNYTLGLDTAYPDGKPVDFSDYSPGKQKGTAKHKLSIGEMPKHDHSGKTSTNGLHDHGLGYRGFDTSGADGADGSFDEDTMRTHFAGDHYHTLDVDDKGGDEAHENRPPYYALRYIIKY
ncbi:MAG: tail fiber protein [Lewinella sp.]|nr:tail fiber protein [Lewinella sp.]